MIALVGVGCELDSLHICVRMSRPAGIEALISIFEQI
jgi:hypothetical protein